MKSLGRILAGKPVYQPGDIVQPGQPAQELPNQPIVPQVGAPTQPQAPKVVSVVRIGRVESQMNGQRMEVFGDIKNESHVPVTLDKVIVLGMQRELDRNLSPGQSHQCLLYSGEPLTRQPSGYADVHYRTQNSDYFSARHQIRAQQLPDKTYRITEFLLTMPINDMH